MDLRFYLSLFLRRLPWFLLFLCAGSAAGLTLARVLPPVYVAQARLVVESEQIPDELAASTVNTQASEQLQIIQQRILARDQLIEMANRLGVYAGDKGRPMAADQIVADLRERIRIVTTGGSTGARAAVQATLVTVSFEAPTAGLAATVANDVVTQILREDVSMRTSVARQTLDFFEQEVARLDQELARQGAEILAFKEENKDALPDSLDFRRSQQAAAQERLAQLDRDAAALKDRRVQLVQVYEATGRIAAAPAVELTPEEAQLKALRDERTRAVAVLSPANPKVKLLDAQIASLEAVVAEQAAAASPVSETSPVDPARAVYDLQLADIDGQIAFLDSQRSALVADLDALQASIEATPANTITLDTLERDYNNTRAQYDETVAKKVRAETGEVIEALSKGQRITVIEQAVAPQEPTSPDRVKIAAAGIGGGLAMGFGIVVLLELLHSGIRRPQELTAKLGITAFATLPYMRTRRQILRRRLIIGAAMAVVVVGIPAGLWAVDTYYAPLDLLIDRAVQKSGIARFFPSLTGG